MLFNSIEFAIFLPTVFILYWFVFNKNIKQQNLLLLISSYIFYGWWDWRFLILIIFSSFLDYTIGLKLAKTQKEKYRKNLLWLSLIVNLGFLGFFKYFNFFIQSFVDAFTLFGKPIQNDFSLQIILPVGISFYTFQTLSYTIDVYKNKLEPVKNIIAFFAFVNFFPQLVAGPIERAKNLLPQFFKIRSFRYDQAVDGSRQILWGLFKKIVIADNCAIYVNLIYANYTEYNGTTLFLGSILFAFQIYGDFSGYSDIAIGVSRLFGFNLQKNFAFPYFSRDIGEFWRRWHISLSTWFRDYLYIPLGGSKGGTLMKIRNTFAIFLISGFWHGANFTFIFWGLINAIYFLPLLLAGRNRNNMEIVAKGKKNPSLLEFMQILTTFLLTVFAWIFFRSKSIREAFEIIKKIFIEGIFDKPQILPIKILCLIVTFVLVEWLFREKEYGLQFGSDYNKFFRWGIYLIIVIIIILFGAEKQEFIYFQF